MATFASSEFAQKTSEIAEDDATGSSTSSKPEPTKYQTREIGSILALEHELLKTRDRLPKTRLAEGVTNIKGGLSLKKEEKLPTKAEKALQKEKIRELEMEMMREQEQQYQANQQKLREKAELYDRLTTGNAVILNPDESPVEFMVDFSNKKRTAETAGFDVQPTTSKQDTAMHFNPDEEMRVYGVSHKKFHKDEEIRRKEIDELKQMSVDTQKDRATNMSILNQREELKKKKLAEMRKRLNLPEVEEPAPVSVQKPEEPVEKAEHGTPEENYMKRLKSNREWDKGKDRFNRWIEKERTVRDDDFRPPDSYNY